MIEYLTYVSNKIFIKGLFWKHVWVMSPQCQVWHMIVEPDSENESFADVTQGDSESPKSWLESALMSQSPVLESQSGLSGDLGFWHNLRSVLLHISKYIYSQVAFPCTGSEFIQYVKRVNFTGVSGGLVGFNKNGDPSQSSYEILQYKSTVGAGGYSLQTVWFQWLRSSDY